MSAPPQAGAGSRRRPLAAFAIAAAVGAGLSTALAGGPGDAGPKIVLEPSRGLARAATERELPRGEGRSLIERRCATCHALGMILQQRLSSEAWKNEVKKMRGWGAFMDDDEAAAITAVLSANLGLVGQGYVPALLDPAVAEDSTRAEVATGPIGESSRGAETFRVNCAPCHGDAAQGARGPALRGRPIAAQPLRFASVVRAGRGDMPGYPTFDDAAVADMLAFIRAR